MSKSTSMLPTLAGGSGVAAHTLVDADLMKVVDAVTLNADRDRKVTLAELKAFFNHGEQYEILHNPATTGQQILATIPNWNGSANGMTMNYGILRKDSLGIYTLDMNMTSPTAPASWTASGYADIEFIAGTGAGTALWDAFLAKLEAEFSANYPLYTRDFPPPILQTSNGNYPASPFYPKSSLVVANSAAHKLTVGIDAWGSVGNSALWSAMVKPSQMMGFRFTISTRVPA